MALHALALQVSRPSTQVFPHVPQFPLSLVRLTQLPLQPLCPAAQQMPLVQLLLAHCGLVWQLTPLPTGVPQVPAVPQTVPAAVQVPPGPPQQDWPEPPQAQVDVAAAQVRNWPHWATPAPVQQGWPTAPQGMTPVALTVNMVDAPVTVTVTVALRAPPAEGRKLSISVQLPLAGMAAVQPLLTVSSVELLLVSAGTLVARSPPLMIITEVGALTPTLTLPRLMVAGLAVSPTGS